MDLRSLLRRPVFISKSADLSATVTQLKAEEHPFVFFRNGKGIYALKSFDLFVQEPETLYRVFDAALEHPPLNILPLTELHAHILDILAESVTLVLKGNTLNYVVREDFLLTMVTSGTKSDVAWLRNLFLSIPRGLMLVDLNYAAVNSNSEALRMLRLTSNELKNVHLPDLLGLKNFEYVYHTQNSLLNQVITIPTNQAAILVDFVPLVMYQMVTGYALVIQDLPSIEAMAMELDTVKQLNRDLETILSTIYDEIIVVDARGYILRASEHYITSHWNSPPQSLIGQTVSRLLPAQDLINRTIRTVLQSKQKVSLMQNESSHQTLAVGNPILNSEGKLERIVVTSRDLTEMSRLRHELEQTRKQSQEYKRELLKLREQIELVHGNVPVYASASMHEIMKEIQRVAQFSTTVLLQGESGVGKEIIANTLHSLSNRQSQSFVKINCAAIPETLIESELFGYERGAFSGADHHGKTGLIVKAHKGTLFLDEISELPLNTQGKLLRALQEREVYPLGATLPVKFDVQVIAASNRSLADLVKNGKFREDLFYRINVIPIEIPPLRERKEDIALLAHLFLKQFNQTYKQNYQFTTSAMEVLEAYSFPGNVRELQNLIQRIAIKSNQDVIDADDVENVLWRASQPAIPQGTLFAQVIPLKEALARVEEELILMAMRKHQSTVKAAKALGISQASVSRKYRQFKSQRS